MENLEKMTKEDLLLKYRQELIKHKNTLDEFISFIEESEKKAKKIRIALYIIAALQLIEIIIGITKL